MKKILITILALLCCACAKNIPESEAPEKEIAQARWDLLLVNPEPEPYRIQFSLRVGEEGNTRRLTGILWGNDSETLRMDIMAGVGVVVAKIFDTSNRTLLYTPRENKAYVHEGEEKPFVKIGMILPFNFPMLAALLEGQYARVFGHSYSSAEMLNNGDIAYTLDQGPKGVLELNSEGFPVSWTQGKNGWLLSMKAEENSRLPKSLKFMSADGKRAIILVKEREKSEAFNHEQMELDVPASATTLPFSKFRPS